MERFCEFYSNDTRWIVSMVTETASSGMQAAWFNSSYTVNKLSKVKEVCVEAVRPLSPINEMPQIF